jgi:hypothetical protein
MKKQTTYITLFILIFLAAMQSSCSDETFWNRNSSGQMTLTVIAGEMTRGDEETEESKENNIESLDIFFFPSGLEDSNNSTHHIRIDDKINGNGEVEEYINSDALSAIFPNASKTTCDIVVVANADFAATELANITLKKIKEHQESIKRDDQELPARLVMWAEGKVSINTSTKAISGTIVLTRSLAKISLEVKVRKEVNDTQQNDGSVWSPAELGMNSVIAGLFTGQIANDTPAVPPTGGYCNELTTGSHTHPFERVDEDDDYFTYDIQESMYTYPVVCSDDNKMLIKFTVPWQKKGASDTKETSYIVNFSGEDGLIVPNKHYKLSVVVDFIGSLNSSDECEVDYELVVDEWKDAEVEAVLQKAQFLVVDRQEISLYGEDSSTVDYIAYTTPTVTLKSISYGSYVIDKNSETELMLYGDFGDGSSPRTVTADDLISLGLDATRASTLMSSKFSSIDSYINSVISNNSIVSITSTEGLLSGNVTMTLSNLEVANKLSRPVKITVELQAGHLTQEITFTQYPSKYVAFDTGGYVFVDGYFANAIDYVGLADNLINIYGEKYGVRYSQYEGYGDYYYSYTPWGYMYLAEWNYTEVYDEESQNWYYINGIPLSYSAIDDDYLNNYTAYDNGVITGYYSSPYEISVKTLTTDDIADRSNHYHAYSDITDLTKNNVSWCHYGYLLSKQDATYNNDFYNTINVSVTAFSSSNYDRMVYPYCNTSGEAQLSPAWIYSIGDARIMPSSDTYLPSAFTADKHDGELTDGELYDYMVYNCYMTDYDYWDYSTGSCRYPDYDNPPSGYGWKWSTDDEWDENTNYWKGSSTYGYWWRNYCYRAVHSWSDADKIKVGATGSYRFTIAPSFKCQSTRGANYEQMDYLATTKRAATFQEAGYPAGRWRLPTCVELYYMMKLQVDEVISGYFTENQWYWAAGDYLFKIGVTTSGTKFVTMFGSNFQSEFSTSDYGSSTNPGPGRTMGEYYKNAGSGNYKTIVASSRFIYDTWYWGDDPDPDCFPNGNTSLHPVFYKAKP